MSNLLPERWVEAELGDTCFVTKLAGFEYTQYFDYSIGGEVIAVRVLNLKKGKLDLKSVQRISRKVSEGLPRSRLAKHDIVISYVGTVGEVAIINEDNKYHLAPNVAKISPDSSKIIGEYLVQVLTSDKTQKSIQLLGSITSQPSLSMGNLRKVYIPSPPLAEQQKIAKILTSVDEVIEKTQAQIDKLKDLKTGMMQELLTNGIGHTEFKESPVGRIPAEWDVVRVDEIVTKVGSGVTPKGGSKAYVSSGIPLIRSQNVHSDGLRLDNVSFITAEQHQKMKGSQLQANDVLLNITGASIGRCYYLADDFIEGNVNQHVCIIRLKKHVVSHVFITLLLNGQLGQTQIMSLQAGGNREGLNFQQIREIKLPLPPIEEQIKISNTLSSIERKIRIKESKLNAVIKIKKALMQDLLTGKVRVKVDSE